MDSVREEGKKQTYLQCARAIKVKPKKSFNKKVKIVQDLTYDNLIAGLKNEKLDAKSELPKRFLKTLSNRQRAKVIVSFLDTTPYNSYMSMMKTFKRAIERFELTGDKEQLMIYKRNLTDSGEPLHKSFTLVREAIVLDLVNDDVDNGYHAIDEALYGLTYNLNEEISDFDEYYSGLMRKFLIHAAPFKWPDAKNLKVLFGDQKNE